MDKSRKAQAYMWRSGTYLVGSVVQGPLALIMVERWPGSDGIVALTRLRLSGARRRSLTSVG